MKVKTTDKSRLGSGVELDVDPRTAASYAKKGVAEFVNKDDEKVAAEAVKAQSQPPTRRRGAHILTRQIVDDDPYEGNAKRDAGDDESDDDGEQTEPTDPEFEELVRQAVAKGGVTEADARAASKEQLAEYLKA